ncbi:MAG: Rdx family protein [Gemmatimonadota bacterium]|nr:Rdx family protein [Gemmatimonadota bacterium]
MAAAIRERFPTAEIEMIPSGGGRFEVTRDGTPIFQKSKLGRHAQPGEILRLLSSDSA